MSGEVKVVDVNGVQQDTFLFNPWTVVAHQSHILGSKCSTPVVCEKSATQGTGNRCLFCQIRERLTIPTYPDMTFARNKLLVQHEKGFGIEFNCMDALQSVRDRGDTDIQVGVACAWQEARSECEFSKRILNRFDWTFRTDYMGTLLPAADGSEVVVEDTNEEIDMHRLKQKDEIRYYQSVDLFEDELADHGVAQLVVKIRVMSDSFYILMRYFLRVDNIMARVQDVRVFHEVGKNYMLREFSRREAGLQEQPFAIECLTDPVKLSPLLPLIFCKNQKLIFPSVS